MEGSKRIVIGAVLLIVIIVAAVFALKRAVGTPPQAPQLAMMVEKIDMKTLDVITESEGDWVGKYASNEQGFYKSPKTGEYTMVSAIKCAACGQLIPDPFAVAGLRPGRGMSPEQMMKFSSEAKCPRCGKNPYPPEKGAPPPPGPG